MYKNKIDQKIKYSKLIILNLAVFMGLFSASASCINSYKIGNNDVIGSNFGSKCVASIEGVESNKNLLKIKYYENRSGVININYAYYDYLNNKAVSEQEFNNLLNNGSLTDNSKVATDASSGDSQKPDLGIIDTIKGAVGDMIAAARSFVVGLFSNNTSVDNSAIVGTDTQQPQVGEVQTGNSITGSADNPSSSLSQNDENLSPVDWSGCLNHSAPDSEYNLSNANFNDSGYGAVGLKFGEKASQEYVFKLIVPEFKDINQSHPLYSSWHNTDGASSGSSRQISISRTPCPSQESFGDLTPDGRHHFGTVDSWVMGDVSDSGSKTFDLIGARPSKTNTLLGEKNVIYPGVWYITVRSALLPSDVSQAVAKSVTCKDCSLKQLFISDIPIDMFKSNTPPKTTQNPTLIPTVTTSTSAMLTDLPFVGPSYNIQGYNTGDSCDYEGQHPINSNTNLAISALMCNHGVIKFDCSYGGFSPMHPGQRAQCIGR